MTNPGIATTAASTPFIIKQNDKRWCLGVIGLDWDLQQAQRIACASFIHKPHCAVSPSFEQRHQITPSNWRFNPTGSTDNEGWRCSFDAAIGADQNDHHPSLADPRTRRAIDQAARLAHQIKILRGAEPPNKMIF